MDWAEAIQNTWVGGWLDATTIDSLIEYPARLFLAALLGVVVSIRKSPDRYHLSLVEAHALLGIAGALFIVIIAGELWRAVGVMGAASVVRYRYAIRNPRDASTLIIALGLGMACGSNMMGIAIFSAILIVLISLLLKHFPDMLPFGMVHRREEIMLRIQAPNYERTMGEVDVILKDMDVSYTLTSFEQKVKEGKGETTDFTLHLSYDPGLDIRELNKALIGQDIHRLSWYEVPAARG